jgi:hypothetical protein
MFFQFFLSVEQQAKIENTWLEFLVWKEKSNKKMEEHIRKIVSFSPPCPFPASQSLLITLIPLAATITKKRKKRAVEAIKIHPS